MLLLLLFTLLLLVTTVSAAVIKPAGKTSAETQSRGGRVTGLNVGQTSSSLSSVLCPRLLSVSSALQDKNML